MSVRSCRVTIQDLDGTPHTAEVTASSLFEAVAQGLSSSTSPPTLFSGSAARYARICSANGYMQQLVFPVPTAQDANAGQQTLKKIDGLMPSVSFTNNCETSVTQKFRVSGSELVYIRCTIRAAYPLFVSATSRAAVLLGPRPPRPATEYFHN